MTDQHATRQAKEIANFVLEQDRAGWSRERIAVDTIPLIAAALAQARQEERDNQRVMIEAYRAHHDKYHEWCQIDGPPIPPPVEDEIAADLARMGEGGKG